MTESTPTCAKCPFPWPERRCHIEEGKGLGSCPTETKQELLANSLQKYQDPRELEFARNASIQEAECYERLEGGGVKPLKPRILEIAEFAEKMAYQEAIGLTEEQKILPNTFEPMCNPIFQADIVNDEKVDFNIIMGLCVGHDSLVIKHLDAPITVLAVKDRLMGHNPLAAVYNMGSYYAFLNK